MGYGDGECGYIWAADQRTQRYHRHRCYDIPKHKGPHICDCGATR